MMRTTFTSALNWAVVVLTCGALTGCNDYSVLRSGEQDTSDTELDENLSYLRADIFPSNSNEGLLPQTRILSRGHWGALNLDLHAASILRGMVTGWDATPFIEPTVPGTDTAVDAQISVFVEGTVMAFADNTNPATGGFAIEIVPDEGYMFAAIPNDPAELPFFVATGQDFSDSAYLSVGLGFGVPIGGQVTADVGRGISGVYVNARDLATGIAGPTVRTDNNGYYQLRVIPGDYLLEFAGEEGGYIPSFVETVVVEDDAGAQVDLDLGTLEPIAVRGEVLDDSGIPLEDVTVRLVSEKLANNSGATLSIDTKTDQNGIFRAQLLEGQYSVEYIPPYNRSLSPREERYDVPFTFGTQDMGTVPLRDFYPLAAVVLDPDGLPLANVGVSANQVGFGGYAYSAVTDEDGIFAMDLPRSELHFAFTPPQDSEAAVTHLFDIQPDEMREEIRLRSGERVEGTLSLGSEPVSYALVEFRDQSENLYASTVTNSEGGFAVQVYWTEEDWDTGSP